MASVWDKIISPTGVGRRSVWDNVIGIQGDSLTTESIESIRKYEEDLRKAGIEPPKMKNVLGTVNKVLDILRTGEYAVGGLLAGEGVITGIREKISPSGVFGVTPKETKSFWGIFKDPSFYGALALDILFDPVTYLTFGFGGGVKLLTKGGQQVLNKTGKRLLQKASKQFGADSARRMVATHIMRDGGEKYLAKGGLKFMGQEFIPRKVVQAPFKGIDWGLEKLPFTGMAYKSGKQILERAFKPLGEINRLPIDKGGTGVFEEMIMKTQKGIRGEFKRRMQRLDIYAKAAAKAKLKNPGKQIMGAIEFDVRSGNTVLDDIADWMQQSLEQYARAELKVGILGVKIPGYMRHLLTKEGREFLEKGGARVQQDFVGNIKKFRVQTPFAKERKLRKPVSEINDLYQKKFGVTLFEEDAFKAFAQRTFEHIKATRVYSFFKNLVDERIAVPAKLEAKLVRKIGKKTTIARKKVSQDYIDGIKFIETKIPELEGYLVPAPIARYLDQTYKLLTDDETAKGLLGLYDKLFRFWKVSVTGLFPAFHTRNFIGGVFNNWLAGLTNPLWYFKADDLAKGKPGKVIDEITKKVYTYDEIRRLVEDLGTTGMPGMMDTMATVEEMMRVGKVHNIKDALNYPRIFMESVEDRLRIPLFMQRLSKGDTPEVAAGWVFKFHFDYAPEAFSNFERTVVRRLIPFYTWTRGNVPLQIEQMLKQPGKYAGLEKLRRTFEKTSGDKIIDEEEYLPGWLKEMFIFRLPGESKDGLPRYLQFDLPLEDINKLPFTESGRREVLSLLSPFIKYPMEILSNRNIYFGSEIYRADMPKEYQTAKTIEVLKNLPQPIKDYLNFKETKKKNPRTGEFETRYEMDAIKLHAIRSVLAGRFYSTLAQATDSELEVWMRLSRIFGGVPVRPIDMAEEKYRRLKQQESILRQLTTYLKQRGTIPYKTQQRKAIPIGGSVWDRVIQ